MALVLAIILSGSTAASGKIIVLVLLLGFVIAAFLGLYILREFKKRQAQLRAVTLAGVDRMSGLEFERYAGELMKFRGFKIKFTPIQDYGIDIVASRGGDIYGVQLKRYTSKLDQKPVREAVAGLNSHQCNKAMVVTNSFFTMAAKTLADDNDCELVDRDKLGEWILEFQSSERQNPRQAGARREH